jgi:glycosyltransferase involved in cell wall biosynthesis
MALHNSKCHFGKKAFHQAEAIVAVSQQVKQDLMLLGIPDSKIRVILNGVDTNEFYPGYTDRRAWNLPEHATISLFVGDIRSNRKNLETVFRALNKVPKLHLAVVGDVQNSPYPQLADTLGLRERVHFLGYLKNVADIMRASDFLVFPSRYETFGMVVTEAMSSGLPVIISNTVGAAEVVTPHCGTILTSSEDVEGLSKALHEFTNNSTKRRQMGLVAREIAEQHDWPSKARDYMDLFEELVGLLNKKENTV